jgi:hypothetical protein
VLSCNKQLRDVVIQVRGAAGKHIGDLDVPISEFAESATAFAIRVRWLSKLQCFDVLTKHKPKGRRWVTKEQYVRYFIMCYNLLYPDNGMSEKEQRKALEVR